MKRTSVIVAILPALLLVTALPALAQDAAADNPGFISKLWDLLGVFHPATVHMPVALLLVSAAFIVLGCKFKQISPDVAYYTLLLGALSAIGATLMGFAFAPQMYSAGWFDMSSPDKETLFYHRWGGVFVTTVSVICAMLAIRSRFRYGPGDDQEDNPTGRRPGDAVWQVGVLISAAAVGLVGHWGGHLTYGDIYTPRINAVLGIEAKKKDPDPVTPLPAADGKIDFAAHVAPIFVAHCLECHGPKKDKGGLRLHTHAMLLKGGDLAKDDKSFLPVTPGDPDASYMMEVLTTDEEDDLMPPKKAGGPLKAEEIDIIKRWISEGATWPDGLELHPKE
ncbi:MAG: hypothetical protein GC159_16840 [Phycisphaera sp.]|nr:hypothetical protein [Phycisphaera sp.]